MMTRTLGSRIVTGAAIAAITLILLTGCPLRPASNVQTPPAKKRVGERKATFIATGDMMLSRGVSAAMDRARTPDLPFRPLADLLASSDFNFANLECPISGNDRIRGKGLVFNARTDQASVIKKFNFKLVNLANNHAMDQRADGLRFTQKYLDELGVAHVGVGGSGREWEPQVVEANGVRIAFIGASYATLNDNGATRPSDLVARIEDRDRLAVAVKKAQSISDLVVVTMHAGVEYTRKPHQPQVDFAHAAIDAGADIVIGAHPHWIQTTESYRDRLIFYSLGNFIFDQRDTETKKGLVLRVSTVLTETADRAAIDQIELIPIMIDGVTPRRANTAETASILKNIGIDNSIMKGRP